MDDPYFAWLRQQDGKERRGDYGPQVWYHHPPGSCSCESLRSRPQSSGNGFGRKLQQLQDRYSGNRELYERDGIKYLLIDEVVNDEGIVTVNHDDYGIQPFGE